MAKDLEQRMKPLLKNPKNRGTSDGYMTKGPTWKAPTEKGKRGFMVDSKGEKITNTTAKDANRARKGAELNPIGSRGNPRMFQK